MQRISKYGNNELLLELESTPSLINGMVTLKTAAMEQV
jgi:hypothetical protein